MESSFKFAVLRSTTTKLLTVSVLVCSISCADDSEMPLAELTTTEVTEITSHSANSGGNISSDGGSSVTARGVCWGAYPSPTINNDKTSDGAGGGSFISNITGLAPNRYYYVRAYATTANGTAYGLEHSFNTKFITISTHEVTEITGSSAKSGGTLSHHVGIQVIQSGVCWSVSPNPTTGDHVNVDGPYTESFERILTDLTPSTKYYVKAFAYVDAGDYLELVSGDDRSFTTTTATEEEIRLSKLKATWITQSVKNNSTVRTDEYPGMEITIGGTFSADGTYNYSSDADSWPSVSPWIAFDAWKFKPGSITHIFRQSDLTEMVWELSNSDNTLTVSFNYQGPGFNNGRTNEVTGDWDFVFTKQ